MIIETAYKEAFNDVVQTHGERARLDISHIWDSYNETIAYASEEARPSMRRVKWLQAVLVDFSDGLAAQQADWARN